jgi:succinate-semialdehyde dehydrogenase / glutarate-semialdehyde dehydrogenase
MTARPAPAGSGLATPVPGAPTVVDGVLISTSPATGEEIGRFPVHGEAEVHAIVAEARAAAAWWSGLGFNERRKRLSAWRRTMARRIDELTDLMHREGGKPTDDALIEAMTALEHLDWAARKAEKVLGPRRVSAGLLMANQAASVEYPPLGVVGVIGPWNYPVLTPMGSIAYALAGGNAVVFKPSEYTPAVGQWLVDTFAEVVPDQPVLQLVTGLGETGAALCTSGVDKIAFTGSTRTGKRVMAACAETLTPVLMECGGKDVLIVDGDADLEAAADAALWGGMSNAGQTCVGVERIYVVEAAYDRFLELLVGKASKLKAGAEPDADLGAITMPSQIDIISRHIDDALAHGGRAVVGGPESVRAPYVDPVVLVDVPEESAAVQEETFGPTLTVAKVRDIDEAVERANATRYGLGASVFSKRRGVEIARRLRSGMAAVNGVVSFAGIAALPFGGVGDSGFGRIHGEDGLREFTRAKSIARKRFSLPMAIQSFDRTEKTNGLLRTTVKRLYGRR